MPVRSRIKLLAGVAALLGLCAAGAGCQSSPGCQECRATSYLGGPSGTVYQADGTPYPGQVRPVVVRQPSCAEPALASAPTCARCQAATMLKPVPMPEGTETGAWSPVQRVSGEATEGGISRAVSMGVPQANPLIPSSATMQAPGPVLDTRVVAPPPGPATLAPPRPVLGPEPTPVPGAAPVPGPGPGGIHPPAGSGYPELPGPVVTHPLDAPKEFCKRALSAYIIEPPDVLTIDAIQGIGDPKLPIAGPHLVRPDGTIGLGTYGSVFVAGMTIDQAKEQIAQVILRRQSARNNEKPEKADNKAGEEEKTRSLTLTQILEGLKVDVAAYNSKFYYVITDGGGFGEQVVRVPFTGNETVLDAVAVIQGLPNVSSKKRMWVARATEDHAHPYVLPVDWNAIAQCGSAGTNYQLYPGDRVYVNSDAFIRLDSWLSKFYAPIQRTLGITLLGSSVVNSIKNGSNSGAGNSGLIR